MSSERPSDNNVAPKSHSQGEGPEVETSRFEVTPKACGFRSGHDILHLNQIHDELEMEELQRKLLAGGNDGDGTSGQP